MRSVNQIDGLDARILLELDRDPDATVLAIARTLGVARNTVHARLRGLREQRALGSFSKRVDPAALGHPLVAFVSIAVSQASDATAIAQLSEIPQIVEMNATTGDADLIVKVVARDPQHLHSITRAMLSVEGVVRTNTALSLVEIMPFQVRGLLELTAAN
ncbi:Lrp/AsnC ligand binding domain-containing protein [Rathayibacter sp. VKM Ac-2760]|uniref:Lrp/AsnC family transcriptional regulator n=1 Tax=Rathayibacter sp. VKM Ac-2760 TaxID=2609253 RepID=UPI0013168E88|nr:Lrp/AsnC ligand binding domain-containing protein [Rathayibacter sp. VKM Ac-2760]QHC61239.1 AsnC family transcriptional regulator [Rathayibacter sp. VKM Ac-2760]